MGPDPFCSVTMNDGMTIIIILYNLVCHVLKIVLRNNVLGVKTEIVTGMIIRIFEEIGEIFLEKMNH
jgi:hypothetical protein